MTVSQGWEILEWDSGAFGFPVARLDGKQDESAMAGAIDDARRAGVRLVYFFTESHESGSVAVALGGTLISERVTWVRAVTRPGSDASPSRVDPSIVVERWTGAAATPELLHLAREAGRHSRFRVDARIPEGVFERIYDAWINKSLRGEIAEAVMVARDASSLLGLVTLGEKNGRADIGLLAVQERARGRGLGKRLVGASLDWAALRRFRHAQVVTQRANVEACRLYESCGYSIERGELVVHFWL